MSCQLLHISVPSSNPPRNEKNQSEIGALGGIAKLLEALESLSESCEEDSGAFSARSPKSAASQSGQKAAAGGGSPSSSSSRRGGGGSQSPGKQPQKLVVNSSDVIVHVCWALMNLCNKNPQNQARARPKLRLILDLLLLKTSGAELSVLAYLAGCVASLIEACADSQREFARQGGLEVLVAVMKGEGSQVGFGSPPIVSNAAIALAHACQHQVGRLGGTGVFLRQSGRFLIPVP